MYRFVSDVVVNDYSLQLTVARKAENADLTVDLHSMQNKTGETLTGPSRILMSPHKYALRTYFSPETGVNIYRHDIIEKTFISGKDNCL